MARTPARSGKSDSSTAASKRSSVGARLRPALGIACRGVLLPWLAGCFDSPVVPQLYGDRYEKCDSGEALSKWDRANEFIEAGDLASAVGLLRRCVELCPKHVLYHVRYQDVAYALPSTTVDGEVVPAAAKVAMLDYYAKFEDDGESPLAPYFAARLQRLAKREAPAQDLLVEALRRDSLFYFVHYENGLLWRGIGQPQRAAQHFRRALDTRPGFLEARRELADCYDELWEWPRAAQQYRVYLAARPNDRTAQRAYLTLIAYRVDGYVDEAFALVRSLLAQHPDDLSLQMDLAAVYWKKGQRELAAGTYRQILERDHAHARAVLNLGNLYYDIGRVAEDGARHDALAKARLAYRYFRSLRKADDAYDWFDLNLATRARLREIDLELGAAPEKVVTWRDL